MKTINILKVLINVLYVLLITVFALGVAFFIAVLFFNEHLPQLLQGYKMLFTMFDWKLFLVPFTTVINFILFVTAVYFLRKCIKPFSTSEFYSTDVIKNLKKAGSLFVLIGVSTILIQLISIAYIQNIAQNVIEINPIISILNVLVATIDLKSTFLIIIGLFFLLFSKAFANAKELKQENDLTI